MSESAPTATFFAFLPFIFEWEGTSYENDPDDPGGATKYGIDSRSHPGVDIRNLTAEGATAIYWKEYQEDGCVPMPSPYAEVFFNCAVNCGLSRAKGFDKQIPGADASMFLRLQTDYYQALAAAHPVMRKYLKGWLNRVNALKTRFNLQ